MQALFIHEIRRREPEIVDFPTEGPERLVRDWGSHALAGAGKVMTHPEPLRLGRKQLILLWLV